MRGLNISLPAQMGRGLGFCSWLGYLGQQLLDAVGGLAKSLTLLLLHSVGISQPVKQVDANVIRGNNTQMANQV